MEEPSRDTRLARFGPFEANLTTGELRKHGTRLKLQDQPFQVLKMLLARPGELVTREEIRQTLWPSGTFVDFDNGLNAAVNRLREALSDSAESSKYIETLPRRGYRFIGVLDGPGPSGVISGSTLREAEASGVGARSSRPKTAVFAGSGIALAAVLVLGVWFAAFHGRRDVIDSVAVLPFVNASSDSNTEYLSDGITESLINNLSQVQSLRVMARSTMFRYKGKEADPRKVGRDLHVRAVLSGRLLQRDDTLIVQAELLDVVLGTQLWGGQYKRKATDVYAVQEDLSREISDKLRLRLTGEEKQRLTRRYTENAEAYVDYLKGRYFWDKWTEDGIRKGISYFQQALAIDPDYGLAYAGLADAYISLGDFGVGVTPTREADEQAETAARKAIELDGTLAEAHAALAMAQFRYDRDWKEAEQEFKRAIELNPGYATAHHWYAHYLQAAGRTQESLSESNRAYELSPIDPETGVHLQFFYFYTHDYDRVIEQGRRTLEIDPAFHEIHLYLGLAYEQKGTYEEATTEFKKAVELSGSRVMTLSALAHVYGVSGNTAAATKLLKELEDASKQRYVSSYDVAILYAGLGDKNRAFAFLQKAFEEGSYWIFTLDQDPRLFPLRSDPRFDGLLRRAGLR